LSRDATERALGTPVQYPHMPDTAVLVLAAGRGGRGRVSFRREKFVPRGGPDGGDGGAGGDVVFKANPDLATLTQLVGRRRLEAEAGQPGGQRRRHGRAGRALVVEVPVGTVVWQVEFNQPTPQPQRYWLEWEGQSPSADLAAAEDLDVPADRLKNLRLEWQQPVRHRLLARQSQPTQLVELTRPGQTVVVCRGGRGGRGNTAFKSSRLTTPLVAEYGAVGEQRLVVLELKLLAQVGLVGLPNAGKSTLLSRLTKARPKVAAYPFTTLDPHLGVMTRGQGQDLREVVIADIPGLIAGASRGRGLGHAFLRHLEACRLLLYLVYIPTEELANDRLSPAQQATKAWQQFAQLRSEVAAYHQDLAKRPFLLAISKQDLYSAELAAALTAEFCQHGQVATLMSSQTGYGLDELSRRLITQLTSSPPPNL